MQYYSTTYLYRDFRKSLSFQEEIYIYQMFNTQYSKEKNIREIHILYTFFKRFFSFIRAVSYVYTFFDN